MDNEKNNSYWNTNKNESIILVYYINVKGLSDENANHELNTIIYEYKTENPVIRQIFLPILEGLTRVECIYPVMTSQQIADKLANIEKYLENNKKELIKS